MSILAGLIGAGAAAAGNASSIALTNAANKRTAKYQNRVNIENWHMQNEYNSPTSQMARLKEAGLNPNLVYGQSAGGAAGNADAPRPTEGYMRQAPDFENVFLPAIGAYSDFRLKAAQSNNLAKQNAVIEAQALTESARALSLIQGTAESASRTARNRFDLGLANQLRTNSLQVAEANLRNLNHDIQLKQVENKLRNEDLLRKPLERERLSEDILGMRQSRASEYYNTALKRYEAELNARGIQKSDNLILRQLFGENGILSGIGDYVRGAGRNVNLKKAYKATKKAPRFVGELLFNKHKYF